MSKFNPGDVVYNKKNPMYMYLVLADGSDGIRLTSFQEHSYDGTANGLKSKLTSSDPEPQNFYPNLAHRDKLSDDLVLLTNISNVLVHLEIELQKLREERGYEEIHF